MVDKVMTISAGSRIMVLAPVIRERKGEQLHVFDELRSSGFIRARINGIVCEIEHPPELEKNKKHSIDVVIDRLKVKPGIEQRLAESFETAIRLADGLATVSFSESKENDPEQEDLIFSALFACPQCGHSIQELEPRLFSFNNPAGACGTCDGLGNKQFFDENRIIIDEELALSEGAIRGWNRSNLYYFQMLNAIADHYEFSVDTPFFKLTKKQRNCILYGSGKEVIDFFYINDRGDTAIRRYPFEGVIPNMERRLRETESNHVRDELSKYLSSQSCPECAGTRLKKDARFVLIEGKNLPDITSMTISAAYEYFTALNLHGKSAKIAEKILKELQDRLRFLVDVGLNYLTLNRSADTLSGGEAQRIRLASQIGAGLVGVMYILDEPSIGLHQRDNDRLLKTLFHLRDLGNTVIVVEHDEEAIRSADHIIDIGPGAGIHGGKVVAQGALPDILANKDSLTGRYLSGQEKIIVPDGRSKPKVDYKLNLKGASGNNLRSVDLDLPLGLMTCVTGVSGSGKSTLVNGTLYPLAATKLNGATTLNPSPYCEILGLEKLDKVVDIDQSAIGRTPRSNPATYTGIFTPIRELFAGTQEARTRGYRAGRFSFNVKGGRCEACQGDGVVKVEMHFLPDVYVVCDVCKSKRYNRETLEVKYKGKSISEVLELTIESAREFFDAVPVISRKLQTLIDVGLSYIRLGQAATTLSGGEAQRVKLSRELSKRDTGKTLYILDEPTTGLHFHDIKQLLAVLHHLRDQGNTVVIIEHNLDVIKTADWIIDLGPEGGSGGGLIIAQGTPEQVAKNKKSFTGQYIKEALRV